jgi:hypothetical protein
MEKKTPSQPLQGKLIPAVFGDMFVQGIPKSNPLLDGESAGHIADYSLGYLQELVVRVHEVCKDEGQTEERKREACEKLFNLCRDASLMLFKLATAFPELFKSIARERPIFPCLFPAHPDLQAVLKRFLLEQLELGSQDELKLRAPKGRKTFSFRGVNGLLMHYIAQIRSIQSDLRFRQLSNPWLLLEDRQPFPIERLDDEFPLTPANASRWVDVIWDLLLEDIPHPENNPRLRSLGNRPSRADRAGPAGTKSQASYRRGAIKETLRKYLIRMLRHDTDK